MVLGLLLAVELELEPRVELEQELWEDSLQLLALTTDA